MSSYTFWAPMYRFRSATTACLIASAGPAQCAFSTRRQPRQAVLLAGHVFGFGHAVGVEHHAVAGQQPDLGLANEGGDLFL